MHRFRQRREAPFVWYYTDPQLNSLLRCRRRTPGGRKLGLAETAYLHLTHVPASIDNQSDELPPLQCLPRLRRRVLGKPNHFHLCNHSYVRVPRKRRTTLSSAVDRARCRSYPVGSVEAVAFCPIVRRISWGVCLGAKRYSVAGAVCVQSCAGRWLAALLPGKDRFGHLRPSPGQVEHWLLTPEARLGGTVESPEMIPC